MTTREKKAPRAAPPSNPLTDWARQGFASFMAAQRILLDLAAQENALLIGMAREQFGKGGFRPGATLAGIADDGVKNVAAAGKILLDLAAGETALVVEGMKEGLPLPVAAGVVADVARHRAETLIGLQKQMLDAAAEQTHAVAEAYREGEKLQAGARVAEFARRGLEGFVESEKKFLDLAAKEVSEAIKDTKRSAKAPREPMKVLTEVARDGAEKYMEAQKKLVDLAIEQMEKIGKGKGERKEAGRKAAPGLLGELTEKSVHNLVTAEKSLLELAMNRGKGKEQAHHKPAARARGGKVHVAAHKPAPARTPVAVPA
jgi:hypothetical protein